MREIDASVKKGAHGEFARFGKARATSQGQFYNVLQNYRRTMGGDFDDVVGGVGVGFGEVGNDDFIDALIELVWRGHSCPRKARSDSTPQIFCRAQAFRGQECPRHPAQ